MNDPRETSWDWYSDEKTATMCSNEAVWVRKLTALAEQYPDDVVIRKAPEDNDGFIFVKLPKKWFKIKPPTKRNMTDEQREVLADRMRNVRNRTK